MPLTQEQKDHVSAWRREKGIDKCLACGYNGEMQCGDLVAAPIIDPGGEVRLGRDTRTIGVVPVACPSCAYMMLHDPVTMGLVAPNSTSGYRLG